MHIDKVKTFFKQLNIKSYIFIYILLYAIVPIVSLITSRFLTTYFYMAVVVISVLFTFYACSLKNIKEYMALILPFVIYQLLDIVASGDSDFLLAGYRVLLFMFPICLGYYLTRTPSQYSFFTVLAAVLFAMTAVTTIFGCIRNPEAARTLATIDSSQDPTSIRYLRQNIGGYTFVYSAVLLYPCVILAYKMKRLHLAFAVAFALLVFALAVYSEYTYALMLFLVSTLLFFVRRDISLKRFILLVIAFVIGVVLFRTAVAAILTRIGLFIGNETMTQKMTAVFIGQEAVDSLDDSRDHLYMLSIQSFLKHPLFGTLQQGGKSSGNHSFILDNLAVYGAVGGALMVWMYKQIFTAFYQPFAEQTGYGFVVWIFFQPIILSAVNTGMWLTNMCLLAPLMMCCIYQTDCASLCHEHLSKRKPLFVNLLQSKET